MDLIHLLPDSVANQIAAGEVIQRPASVIKELVENSVDAGAKTIHVIVVDAGRTSIQVIDDGKGMSETDARLAFERHATSKISQADDLFALHTMGFRGEALASIAAVAQVELQTRRQEDEIGTKVSIAGSKVTRQEPVSCPVGSNFKVDNLFFNVPARRKFLKTNVTELNNILTAFERIVLVYPDIHFTLHNNGVEMLNLRAGSVRQRIADVFGKQYNQDLVPVEVHTAMCTVSGFVGKPEAARKKTGCDYFFVNGRFMKHPYFHKAVMKAYDRLVPEGMAVPYFLYIEVEPGEIDVNIHPNKKEIRFHDENSVINAVSQTIIQGLASDEAVIKVGDYFHQDNDRKPLKNEQVDIKNVLSSMRESAENTEKTDYKTVIREDLDHTADHYAFQEQPDVYISSSKPDTGYFPEASAGDFDLDPGKQLFDFDELKLTGCIFDTYLTCEDSGRENT